MPIFYFVVFLIIITDNVNTLNIVDGNYRYWFKLEYPTVLMFSGVNKARSLCVLLSFFSGYKLLTI